MESPKRTRWHTPRLLDCMLPSKLSRCSQVHSQACSQVHSQLHLMRHSQPAWQYTPLYTLKKLPRTLLVCSNVHLWVAVKYASNHSHWYTPTLLGSTLPSTLSRGKTLPISLDYCSHVCSCIGVPETCSVTGTGRRETGDVWWVMAGI